MYPSLEYLDQLDQRALKEQRERIERKLGIYRCVICGEEYVDAEEGFDTCDTCARRV